MAVVVMFGDVRDAVHNSAMAAMGDVAAFVHSSGTSE